MAGKEEGRNVDSAASRSVVGSIIVQAGLRQLALGPSVEVMVGREADCDIVLADEPRATICV